MIIIQIRGEKPLEVSFVEDDDVIREGVQEYLDGQDNMLCIEAKSSVEHFLAVLNEENLPDVILMDIGLPGMSGISGMKLINEKYPAVSIIMFTVYIDSHKMIIYSVESSFFHERAQWEAVKALPKNDARSGRKV